MRVDGNKDMMIAPLLLFLRAEATEVEEPEESDRKWEIGSEPAHHEVDLRLGKVMDEEAAGLLDALEIAFRQMAGEIGHPGPIQTRDGAQHGLGSRQIELAGGTRRSVFLKRIPAVGAGEHPRIL
jgi:hypothetical protein